MSEPNQLEVLAPERGPLTVATVPDDKFLTMAIEKGAGPEALKELVALAEHMQAVRAKGQYFDAFARFQAECPPIQKRKAVHNRVGDLLYHFAPLDDIVAQVGPLLQKHGFSYRMTTAPGQNCVKCVCIGIHIAGHSEQSEITIPIEGAKIMSAAQATGAARTFGCRYAFCDLWGIGTCDEDIDAGRDRPMPAGPMAAPDPCKLVRDEVFRQTRRKFQAQGIDNTWPAVEVALCGAGLLTEGQHLKGLSQGELETILNALKA